MFSVKQTPIVLALAVLSAATLFPTVSHAESSHQHHATAALPPLAESEGEVRRVDLAAGKITIKHGPIVAWDMPPMTMVFAVDQRALLEKIEVGQKVKFQIKDDKKRLVIVQIDVQ